MYKLGHLIKNNGNLIIQIFFFLFLITIGLNLYNDFGVSMDEDAYKKISLVEYKFLKTLFFETGFKNFNILYQKYLSDEPNKVSGFFYNFVYLINEFSNIFFKVSIELKKISHILLNLIFIVANFCLFKIILKRFNNYYYAYLSVLILFFTPRFFAESFYNNRDIYFLSISLFSFFYLQKLFLNLTFKNIIIYSFLIATLINAKIFGLVFFVTSIFFLILEYENSLKKNNLVIKILLLIFLSIFFTILITPYLWSSPLNNFINFYFKDLIITSQIRVSNLFYSKLFSSLNSPWYYYLVWILVTIPTTYVILIFSGFFYKSAFFLKKIITQSDYKNPWTNKNELFDAYTILICLIFLFAMSRVSNVNYDSWRHIYFLYPYLLINIFFILEIFNKNKYLKTLLPLLIMINVISNIYWMNKNHPFQNIFFNNINNFFLKKKFDLDYWGLSNYQAYKFILKNDYRNQISIGTLSFNDLIDNYNILDINEQKRIVLLQEDMLPDYFIDNYRVGYKVFKTTSNKNKILYNYSKYKEFVVDNNVLLTIYKKN